MVRMVDNGIDTVAALLANRETCECPNCGALRFYKEQCEYIASKYKRAVDALPYRLPPDEERGMRRKMSSELDELTQRFRAAGVFNGICYARPIVLPAE